MGHIEKRAEKQSEDVDLCRDTRNQWCELKITKKEAKVHSPETRMVEPSIPSMLFNALQYLLRSK